VLTYCIGCLSDFNARAFYMVSVKRDFEASR
jgi:hypothetical protein